jgi:hypothetical protein
MAEEQPIMPGGCYDAPSAKLDPRIVRKRRFTAAILILGFAIAAILLAIDGVRKRAPIPVTLKDLDQRGSGNGG